MKRFSEFLIEMADGHVDLKGEVVFKQGEFVIKNSLHGKERIEQRNTLPKIALAELFRKTIEKVAAIGDDIKTEVLFYSEKLRQGFVAAYDAVQKAVRIITFLPRNKHFAKPGTEEIVLEGIGIIPVIYID